MSGDAFVDLVYLANQDAGKFDVYPYVNDYDKKNGGGIAQALEKGRDAFLEFVDQTYEDQCVDIETHAHSC